MIVHIDMDAFFASCEEQAHPEWKGEPLMTVSGLPRGVVTSANRIAKETCGVKTGMSLFEARKLCPRGRYVEGDLRKYVWFSDRLDEILLRFSPHIERYSIDELFVDLRGTRHDERPPVEVGMEIQASVQTGTGGLPCTVGVGTNRYLAKMGTGWAKPHGVKFFDPKRFAQVYGPQPTGELWGIGPKTEETLTHLGVFTVEQLARFPVKLLTERFGVRGEDLHRMAVGEDSTEVGLYNDEDNKSVGNSHTLDKDTDKPEEIERLLFHLCDEVGCRMRTDRYGGRTVHLWYRIFDFTGYGKQMTLPDFTDLTLEIYEAALHLWWSFAETRSIRAMGVSVSKLTRPFESRQGRMFTVNEQILPPRYDKAIRAMDALREKHGDRSLLWGKELL